MRLPTIHYYPKRVATTVFLLEQAQSEVVHRVNARCDVSSVFRPNRSTMYDLRRKEGGNEQERAWRSADDWVLKQVEAGRSVDEGALLNSSSLLDLITLPSFGGADGGSRGATERNMKLAGQFRPELAQDVESGIL